MAIFQSPAALGTTAIPSAYQAGIVTTAIFKHTFTAAFDGSEDVLEIGLIPANVQVLGATLISGALGALTADVGIMTGTPGDATPAVARTSGDELIDGGSVNGTVVNGTLADCLAIAPSETHRAIGVKLSGDVVAGATKTLTLRLDYMA